MRNHIVSKMNGDATMLEICSSDTHSTSGKRTRVGYFALGTTTSPDKIAKCIISFAQRQSRWLDLHLSLLVPNQPSR